MRLATVRALVPGMAVALLLWVSGCSTSPSATDSRDAAITFTSYSYGTQGAAGTGTQKLLDRFAELHPEITVEPQSVAVGDVLTSARAATAAGEPPDVVQLGYSKLAEGLESLPVQPLPKIAGDAWPGHVAGIVPGPVATGTRDNTTYALPFTVSIPTVLYNADLFERAGLDADRPPTTIAEVRATAQAITRAGAEGVYFAIVDSSKSDYLTQSVMNSAGGGLLDANGAITLDSAASTAGLQQIQALTTDGLQPAVSTEDALAAFSSGKLGMLVVSTAVLGTVQKAAKGNFELRSAALPAFGPRPAAPTHSGAALVVLSDDEAKQRAAWQLVEFLTSEEGYRIIATEIGYLPMRQTVIDDLQPWLADNPLLLPTIGQLESMRPYQSFPGPRSNQATQLLQDEAVAPIVLRGADAPSTLKATANRIRELVGTS